MCKADCRAGRAPEVAAAAAGSDGSGGGDGGRGGGGGGGGGATADIAITNPAHAVVSMGRAAGRVGDSAEGGAVLVTELSGSIEGVSVLAAPTERAAGSERAELAAHEARGPSHVRVAPDVSPL